MLRILLFLSASINLLYSQMQVGGLYIGNNTYIYVKDNVLTANKNIRMETSTSNIYLRGTAQLYQIDNHKNLDAGELSVYQEQNTGIYDYNYWCSPVGVSADGTTPENKDFNGSNIHDPSNASDLTNVTATDYLFTSNLDGTATELSSEWIYTYSSGEGYYDWNQVYNTGNIGTGYGFTLKGSPNANNTLDFRGRPNNGTILVNCSYDGTDNQPNSGLNNYAETLTGNPYPSALDLKLFFVNSANNQSSLADAIYFWEQKPGTSHNTDSYQGGYGVYSPNGLDPNQDGIYVVAPFESYNLDGTTNTTTSGNTKNFSANNQRRYAAIGQGFFIASNVNGGYAEFKNDMRVYLPEDCSETGDGAVFYKNSKQKSSKTTYPMANNGIDYRKIYQNQTTIPEIRIHTHINNTFYKEVVIALKNDTPDNYTYNKFYDAMNINQLNNDAYMLSDNIELVIKSINYNEDVFIPFGVKFTALNPTISVKVNSLKDFPQNTPIYLYDSETDTYTDIINSSFDLSLSPGVYNNRFKIVFKNTNTLITNQSVFENIKVIQNNSLSQLKIQNTNNIDIKSISLIDVSGKQLIIDTNSKTQNEISYSTKSLTDGLYIVKITTNDNLSFTKKIMVSNKNI